MPPHVTSASSTSTKTYPRAGSTICKAPPSTPKIKTIQAGKDGKSRLARAGLHILVDANGHEHLVYSIHFLHNPDLIRVCFVEARGTHALVRPDILRPAPANIDLSTVDSWWQMRSYHKSRDGLGVVFFPPPPGGFKKDDFVTVVIPDVPALPALVTEVYTAATGGGHVGKHYRVLYSQDSDYDTGLVTGFEVVGPGIMFSPTTDFKRGKPKEAEERPPSPPPDSPVALPDFTPADARIEGMSPTGWTIPRLPSATVEHAFANGAFIGSPPPPDPAFVTPEDPNMLFFDKSLLQVSDAQEDASGAVGVDDLNFECFESMPSSPL